MTREGRFVEFIEFVELVQLLVFVEIDRDWSSTLGLPGLPRNDTVSRGPADYWLVRLEIGE
jgi:hypothetical protein